MISVHDAQSAIAAGGQVLSSDGQPIGSLVRLYLDDDTGEPSWAGVASGPLGGGESLVPVGQSSARGNDLQIPFTLDDVRGAPAVDASDGHLSVTDDAALHRYYEGRRPGSGAAGVAGRADQGRSSAPTLRSEPVDAADTRTDTDTHIGTDSDTRTDTDTDTDTDSAAVTGAADGSGEPGVVRSEEQLRIRTERVPTTRVRLRKVVVTENVTQTIPVSHEEFRLEEVPIDAADLDADGAVVGGETGVVDLAGLPDGYEVVLRAERVVVTKEVAPVERVRVWVETVAGERRVTAEVQKERVVADEVQTSDLTSGQDHGLTG